jgi:hypothetical protein
METQKQKTKEIEKVLSPKAFARAFGGQLHEVQVPVFSPYMEFAVQYCKFFGKKRTIETFFMELIYDGLERLHRDLTEFVQDHDSKHFIDFDEWYEKNPHLSCVSDHDEEEQQE